MYLTANFSLAELSVSQTAARRGINNTPPDDVIDNIRSLASMLEDVRRLLGKPITISSGYRSPELNKAIGGSASSQHCKGQAADFICPGYGSSYEVAKAIQHSSIRFDQLIYEGTWCHISTSPDPRGQALTARFNPTKYENGINK